MQVLLFTAFKGNVMKFPISCCAGFRDVLSVVNVAFLIECADEYAGRCSQINLINIYTQNPSHLGLIFSRTVVCIRYL